MQRIIRAVLGLMGVGEWEISHDVVLHRLRKQRSAQALERIDDLSVLTNRSRGVFVLPDQLQGPQHERYLWPRMRRNCEMALSTAGLILVPGRKS